MKKRIVLTGGPASGKTTLLNYIRSRNYFCFPEVSRDITKKAQEQGIPHLFLKDPLAFSQEVWKQRRKHFRQADSLPETSSPLFYDRGLPDTVAYHRYTNEYYPEIWDRYCQDNRYDCVFYLPPWKEIYVQDTERYETFAEAEKIAAHLKETYESYKYTVIEIVPGSLEDRFVQIKTYLRKKFLL